MEFSKRFSSLHISKTGGAKSSGGRFCVSSKTNRGMIAQFGSFSSSVNVGSGVIFRAQLSFLCFGSLF